MKVFPLAAILSLSFIGLHGESKCPLMVEDGIDQEESVVVEGKSIGFCCGTCVRKFEENKAYYIKAVKYLNDLFAKQTHGVSIHRFQTRR